METLLLVATVIVVWWSGFFVGGFVMKIKIQADLNKEQS